MALEQKRVEESGHDYFEGIGEISFGDTPDDLEQEVTEPAAPASAPAHTESQEPSGGGDGEGPRRHATPVLLGALAVIAVIVAAVLGYFVGSGGFAQRGVSSATVTEDQLDQPIATYTYNGATHEITAREAIESQYSLDTVKNEDGTYTVPSADTTLTYARNQIQLAEAEARGIEVSDEEALSFAESTLGLTDYADIAERYGVSEDQAKEIVRENAMISKLSEQIAPTPEDVTLPEMPAEPADGDESAASAEYASYIINLVGDEWDASTGTWTGTDGPYYAALGAESFSADSATYTQAMMAYYVAYQQYAEAAGDASDAWISYINELFADASITIWGLYR